ncbi:MAG: ABC transporter, ATP-binding protein [Rhodanobacteraceae bacterium]|jgi:putative ABC transport system permease protein|nr:MAG: ABC transporter, ATP-binding protein [Rhodanobacteraceae bacterium]
MLGYYLDLALRSLKRNKLLTALMIVAIGFGVAASMITYSVFRAVSGNPIPDKSAQLFTPQIDSWGPQQSFNGDGEPPQALDYTDAMALMRAHAAKRQTLIYPVLLTVLPGGDRSLPIKANGYAVYADFFPMFEVPFRYGSGWEAAQDENRAPMIVLSEAFNRRIFGNADSVGREINLDGHEYRVAGVARHWNPQPRFYALFDSDGFGEPADFYIPFTRAVDLQIPTNGNNSCRGTKTMSGWDSWLHGNCVWINPWVELDTPAEVARYRNFLEGYAAEQRRAGRFDWAPNVRLRDVTQWLDFMHVVPPESRISLLVSLGFFVICLVNTVGLLLAKFMRRAGEIGVRRALGASRREIYMQFLVEAGTVGAAGGLLGLVLTAIGVSGVGLLFRPEIAQLAHIDLSLVALTLAVAIAATVVAAFYPTWRAAHVQPAWHLRSN